MSELKPCPWEKANTKACHVVFYDEFHYQYSCACGASGPIMETQDQAFEAWNTRAGDVNPSLDEALNSGDGKYKP